MVGRPVECPRDQRQSTDSGEFGGFDNLLGATLHEHAPSAGAVGVVVIDLEGDNGAGGGGRELGPGTHSEDDVATMQGVVDGQDDGEGCGPRDRRVQDWTGRGG